MHNAPQRMAWSEAPPPAIGLGAAAGVAIGAVAIDTALASAVGQPGAVLDWLPLAAAGAAFLAALRFAGAVRQAALTATIAFLALYPLLHPSPAAWMYAVPLLGVAFALGLALTPTARAVAALPAIAGMLAMLELLPGAVSATLVGALAFGAYLVALWFELPSLALPTLAVKGVAPDANESGEQA